MSDISAVATMLVCVCVFPLRFGDRQLCPDAACSAIPMLLTQNLEQSNRSAGTVKAWHVVVTVYTKKRFGLF
jgi:hypothetical protein